MKEEHDYDLSRDLGARAMGYLKEIGAPAAPANYALLYRHAAGYDRVLSSAIQELVRDAACSPAELNRLHDIHLAGGTRLVSLQRSLDSRAKEVRSLVDRALERDDAQHAALLDAEALIESSHGAVEGGEVVRKLLAVNAETVRRRRDLETSLERSLREVRGLTRQIHKLRAEAESDPSTGALSRRRFMKAAQDALEHARQAGQPLALLIVDIDALRPYNEAHGRHIGDKVIRHVAGLIRQGAGARNIVARYAGDQFAVLLAETTLETAVRFAEQIRVAVQAKKFVRKASGRSVGGVTVSIGVALYGYGDTAEALVERALEGLRAAKRLGRNRVRSAANADEASSGNETPAATD